MKKSTGTIIIGLLLATAGCKDGSGPERLAFAVLAGNGQNAAAGQAVAVAPSVRVSGSNGGVQGVTVVFSVVSGGGSVTGSSQTTNADGVATIGSWTLGQSVGENTLTATVQGREVDGGSLTFTATATAGPAARVEKQAGDGQIGTVATPIGVAPAVLVTDAFQNPVGGVDVMFDVASGGGSVTGASQSTGANGIASVGSWVLGEVAGENTLEASASGLTGSPATFTATAAAGPVASLEAAEGDNQTAPVGTAVPTAPVIRARDAFGNEVAGLPVNFAVTLGGGAAAGTAQITDAGGRAAVGSWTLGSVPGLNQLTAMAAATATATPVVFSATATALFNASRYAGTWTGTWINTTFSSTGTNTLTISADESAMTVTIAFSTTGPALGVPGGVATQSNMTSYEGTGFTATANLNVYGATTLTVDADGNVTASGVNIPQPGFDRWDATGTITDTQLVLDWTVSFTGGGSASGRTTLTKQ